MSVKTPLLFAGVALWVSLLFVGCLSDPPKSGQYTYKTPDMEVAFKQPESSRTRTEFVMHPDGSVVIVFGSQYNVEKIRQAYKAFSKYHVAAILLIIAGVAMRVSRLVPNKWAYSCMATGMFLGFFGHFVPSVSPWAMGACALSLVGCGVYYVWRKGLLTPTPETEAPSPPA